MQQPKLIYIAHRRSDFTPPAFTARWRQHAALGMSQARWINVARYLHCDRLAGLPPDLAAVDCDGVAVVLFRSEAHRQHHIAQEESRLSMKADELETFDGPLAPTSLLTHETLVCAGPEGPYKLFVFWQAAGGRDGDAELDGFVRSRQARAREWRQETGENSGIRLVQNFPVQPRAQRMSALPCDGVDEFSATDLFSLQTVAQHWVNDSPGPVTARMVLTRVVILHDEPLSPVARAQES